MSKKAAPTESAWSDVLFRRHMRFGWWSLLVFLSLGIALEVMHGLKVDWYLSVGNSTRRLMWTLAHSHGALLGLVHVAYAFSVRALAQTDAQGGLGKASHALSLASLLLPGGFFLGGITIYSGDPGRGVLLVPVGALALLLGVLWTALALRRL